MLVKSSELGQHLTNLREVFAILKKYKMRLNSAKCALCMALGKFLGFMVNQRGIEANLDKIPAILNMEVPKSIKDVQRLAGRLVALTRFVSRSMDRSLPFFKILKGIKKFKWTKECDKAFAQLKACLTQPPLLPKPKTGESLLLYLAVSPTAVSSVLIREEVSS